MKHSTAILVTTLIVLLSLAHSSSWGTNSHSNGELFSTKIFLDTVAQTLPFNQNWSDTSLISRNDDWSNVPGIIGYRGDTAGSVTAVDPRTIISPRTDTIDVIANQSNPNTLTAGGVAEFDGIPNPTIALQGSGTADAPFILISINTVGQTNIHMSYNLRDIDGSTDNAIQPVALQYRVGDSGNFTNIPEGYVADATTGPSLDTMVTPVSVTLPSAVENQPKVQLRIITTNAIGSDEWVGIDDIHIAVVAPTYPSFSVTPSELDFGEVFIGQSITDTLTVENMGTASLHIDSITSNHGEFTVTPTSAVVADSTSEKFYVVFTPISSGVKSDTIIFYHDATGSPSVVAVTGTALPAGITLDPRSIDFGDLLVGSTHTDTVTVLNGRSNTLTISSVVSTDSSFTIYPTGKVIDPWSKAQFAISFAPPSTGLKTATIAFFELSAFMDSILVRGTGTAAGFSVAPSSLTFGNLFIDSTLTDTLEVSNSGTGTLTITAVTSTDTDFAVAPMSASITAGSSELFYVTFTPKSIGNKSGKIIFSHNATHSSADSVSVSGYGLKFYTIANARAATNGTEVTIRGIVTRALGAYTRLQDSSGGIVIYQSSGAYHDSVASRYIAQGDLLRITGKTSEYYDLKEIASSALVSYTRISRGNELPTPQVVTLAEIAANGENYESELITVKKMTIVSGGDATFSAAKTYQISDSSDATNNVALRISNASDTYIDGMPMITLGTFTGVLGQFSSSSATAGYQLQPIDSTDLTAYEGVKGEQDLPAVFALNANYPNPFNPGTTIGFDLPKQTFVTLDVYNLVGQRVATLLTGRRFEAGRFTVSFDASRLPSGMYFYRLTTPEFYSVKKMLLLK